MLAFMLVLGLSSPVRQVEVLMLEEKLLVLKRDKLKELILFGVRELPSEDLSCSKNVHGFFLSNWKSHFRIWFMILADRSSGLGAIGFATDASEARQSRGGGARA